MIRRASLLLATLLAGCDLAPTYQPPAPILPASYHGAGPFAPASPADRLSRGDWWQVFNDPELNRLEQSLETRNPNLAAAAESYTQARDYVAEARSGLFPTLGAGGLLSDNRQSARRLFRGNLNTPSTEASNIVDAAASWEPDFWDQIRNETRAAKANAQAAAADLATARLSLEAELASDYMALRGLDAEQAIYDQTTRYYKTAVEITSLRLHDKISAAIDNERARNQLAAVEAAATDVRGARALLMDAIATLAGVMPGTMQIQPIHFVPPPPGGAPDVTRGDVPVIPVGVPSSLLQRRPDIAAAERAMAAANAQIGVARAAFYPNVMLNGIAGIEDNGFDLISLPNSLWAIGAGAVAPLFEGGLRRAEAQKSWSGLVQTADNYRATVLSAMQEVEDDLALTGSLKTEEDQDRDAVKAALQVQSMSLNLYTGGLTDYLDVTVAQQAALTAELAAIQVHARRMQNAVDLVRALGGGWSVRDMPTPDQTIPFNPLGIGNGAGDAHVVRADAVVR